MWFTHYNQLKLLKGATGLSVGGVVTPYYYTNLLAGY